MRSTALLLGALLGACDSPPRSDAAAAGPAATEVTPATGPAGAQAAATLRPLAVGQWAEYRTTRADGTTSSVKYQVVAEEEGQHWLEMSSGVGLTIQLLVASRGAQQSADIVAARMRLPSGELKESRGEALEKHKVGFGKLLGDVLVPNLRGSERRDVTVPAGTFPGAFLREHESDVSGELIKTRTFSHPSVPISGLVLSEGVLERFRMELVAYGTTGAKSSQ
ncbi:MAG: hypothetical protein KF718_06120 [Polyangiaceae bacterium]|nr:hypothetical protein [Polyangiaceae bacterium]